ncbi:unnamed protein product [Ceutorhynchus assimilis]|uniref:CCHC-type domain-containing protein n=1 Tax=Ceutorhynchus assimilis TaxID=467358 RepID=A0A9N9QNS8_9CUCU|nr:unnamed protein product [Ceutorhynchus assimilis]
MSHQGSFEKLQQSEEVRINFGINIDKRDAVDLKTDTEVVYKPTTMDNDGKWNLKFQSLKPYSPVTPKDSVFLYGIAFTAQSVIRPKHLPKNTMPVVNASSISGASRTVQVEPKKARCFNCYKEGHLIANCPKPKREKGPCFSCGSKQHLRNVCPQRTSVTPASTTMVIGSSTKDGT